MKIIESKCMFCEMTTRIPIPDPVQYKKFDEIFHVPEFKVDVVSFEKFLSGVYNSDAYKLEHENNQLRAERDALRAELERTREALHNLVRYFDLGDFRDARMTDYLNAARAALEDSNG